MHAEVEIITPEPRARYVIMPGEFLVFGRGQNADIILQNDHLISRLHFKIYYDNKQYWLQDLNSRNHIYVNKKQVSRHALVNGDEIRAGKHQLQFVVSIDEDQVKLPAPEPFLLLKRDEKLIGKIAVRLGMISKDDLKRCAQKQQQIAMEGPYYPLAEVLVQEGYLDEAELAKVDEYKKCIPFRIPNYRLEELIGMGGMGRIYQARCLKTGSRCACKIFCEAPQELEQELLAQFKQEAEALLRLQNQNIVAGIETGEHNGTAYLVMEYVEGPTLQQYIKDQGGRLLPDQALEIAIQLSRALDHAHAHAIIHRDIKPENVLLTTAGAAKLCDFGLVKDMTRQKREDKVFGTVAYMSPEQIRLDQSIDIRSDIYSLGALFYRMLFGKLPFVGSSKKIRMQHLSKPIVFPDEGRHFQKMELARVIRKMMSKSPDARYQSPQELLHELESVKLKFEQTDIGVTEEVPQITNATWQRQKPLRRLLWNCAIALVLIGLLAFAAGYYRQSQQEHNAYLAVENASLGQNYAQVITSGQAFLRDYSASQYHERVQTYIQQAFWHQATQLKQQQPQQALESCRQALAIPIASAVVPKAKELLEQLQQRQELAEKIQLFRQQLTQSDGLLNSGKLDQAARLLKDLAAALPEENARSDWQRRWQRLTYLRQQQQLASCRYYFPRELPQVDAAVTATPAKLSIGKVLLGHDRPAFGASFHSRGCFFVPIAGHLHCLNAKDGSIRWSFYTGECSRICWLLLSEQGPVLDSNEANRVLIVAKGMTTVAMLHLNGKQIWQRRLTATISSEPGWHKNQIYLGCSNRYTYRIRPESGAVAGAFFTQTPIVHAGTGHEDAGLLYLAARHQLYGFDLASGRLRLFHEYQEELVAAPVAALGYWLAFLGDGNSCELHFYDTTIPDGRLQAPLLDKVNIPGKLVTPPRERYRSLLLHTTRYFGMLPLFTARQTAEQIAAHLLPLGDKSPPLMALAPNKILVAGEQPAIYTIVTASKPEWRTLWQYRSRRRKFPGNSYRNWQKAGDLYFVATHKDGDYWGNTLYLGSSRKQLLWLRRLGAGIVTAPVVVAQKAIWLTTSDGALFLVIPPARGLTPRYRMQRGHPYWKVVTQLLYFPRDQGQIVIMRNIGPCKMIKANNARTIRDWRLPERFNNDLGGLAQTGKVMFVARDKSLKAFSLISGRQLSDTCDGKAKFTSPPVYFKGSIFVGDAAGNYFRFKLALSRGKIVFHQYWRHSCGAAIHGQALVSLQGLYFGSDNGRFYRLNPAGGRQYWEYASGAAVRSSPLLLEKMICFGNDAGKITAVDAASGKLLWQKQLDGAIRATPLLHQGKIYVLTHSGQLAALAPRSGMLLWRTQLPGSGTDILFSCRELLYAGANDGFLYLVRDRH